MKTLKKCMAVVFLLAFLAPFVQGQVPPHERFALIAIYNATNGDSWSNNFGWKTGGVFSLPGTEGGWYGVKV